MKKHLFSILIVAMFLIGLSVLLYPAISEYVNSKHASRVIASYNDALATSDDRSLEGIFNAASDYNKRLSEKPNAFFDPSLVPGYNEALDVTHGIMGYIDIDKINVELPIYHGVEKEVLQVGIGHLPGTSLPVGGESTHSVLSGHRGLPSAKLFTDLDDIEIGDEFTITILNRLLTYKVDQIKNEAFKVDTLIVTPITAIPLLIIALFLVFTHDKRQKRRSSKSGRKAARQPVREDTDPKNESLRKQGDEIADQEE